MAEPTGKALKEMLRRYANRERMPYEQEGRAQAMCLQAQDHQRLSAKPIRLEVGDLEQVFLQHFQGGHHPGNLLDFQLLSSKTVRQYFRCLSGTLMWEPWRKETAEEEKGGMARGGLNKA